MADDIVYIFQANGDACDICSGLDGAECADLPHDGCACQIVAITRHQLPDGTTYSYSPLQTARTGDGPKDYVVGTDVEVECCDGSMVGESVEIDAHGLPDIIYEGDAWDELVMQILDDKASELADECPDCDDMNVA